MKLHALKPKVATLKVNRLATLAPPSKANRITGRALHTKRWNMWKAKPYCAGCGRLLDWPAGFELDHIKALHQGGTHDETNLQLLCVWYGEQGKMGCHVEKTREEGSQGWNKG